MLDIRVYPRWRGEHFRGVKRALIVAGLSPLARGTLSRQVLPFPLGRFIPAGAGNTPSPTIPIHAESGLSPLARGTRDAGNGAFLLNRFIPAGAGNTCHDVIDGRVKTVYPRWRGEHFTSAKLFHRFFGLSPLARGTLQIASHQHGSIRFIPAGAGNTYQASGYFNATTVYPRWRGEHLFSPQQISE